MVNKDKLRVVIQKIKDVKIFTSSGKWNRIDKRWKYEFIITFHQWANFFKNATDPQSILQIAIPIIKFWDLLLINTNILILKQKKNEFPEQL